mmetsp:Transcript_34153/g.97005  ORF Transcript_34153/g.97005 Transcript_34153/m.97005 type:complete len:237 (+) Transcript_34153:130-840(+)
MEESSGSAGERIGREEELQLQSSESGCGSLSDHVSPPGVRNIACAHGAAHIGGRSSSSALLEPTGGGVSGESVALASRRASWWLVWCHERVFKQTSMDIRRRLDATVDQHGGSVTCLRRAQHFSEWLWRKQRKPYVLLISWREVKPAWTLIERCPLEKRPLSTLVVCEESPALARASAWVQGRSPLRAMLDYGGIEALLLEHIREHALDAASRAPDPSSVPWPVFRPSSGAPSQAP